MKASELRDKSVDELNKELEDLLRESFSLRMQLGAGQLGQSHLVRINRRSQARIKTVLREKASN